MSQKEIKIGVIGAGSIGSLFGGYLASITSKKYSIKVILFGRKTHVDAINKNGLKIEKDKSTLTISNVEAFHQLGNLSLKFDFIFLTTKTYDLKKALIQYKSLIDNCEYAIILQNGLGNEDLVKEYCSVEKIIRAVTINGVFLDKPGHLIHSGVGMTKIGFPFEKPEISKQASLDLNLLKDLLNTAGLDTIIVNDILKECWEKTFINIGINAFGALTRLKNGELLESEELKKFMAEAVNEALTVAKKRNIILSNKDYIALTYEVAQKTSENKNSMLQDILKGKNTEIDFINGRIVEYAKELEINVPINELLTSLIQGCEKSLL